MPAEFGKVQNANLSIMFVYLSALFSIGVGAEGEISQNLGNIHLGESQKWRLTWIQLD